LRTSVKLDGGVLAEADRAWLRFVVEGVAPGEGWVSVRHRTFKLPAAATQEDMMRIVELPVDVADLGERNDVRFTVTPGNHLGYRVAMTSIVLETRDRPPAE
jgi:hypothetical protein